MNDDDERRQPVDPVVQAQRLTVFCLKMEPKDTVCDCRN